MMSKRKLSETLYIKPIQDARARRRTGLPPLPPPDQFLPYNFYKHRNQPQINLFYHTGVNFKDFS